MRRHDGSCDPDGPGPGSLIQRGLATDEIACARELVDLHGNSVIDAGPDTVTNPDRYLLVQNAAGTDPVLVRAFESGSGPVDPFGGSPLALASITARVQGPDGTPSSSVDIGLISGNALTLNDAGAVVNGTLTIDNIVYDISRSPANRAVGSETATRSDRVTALCMHPQYPLPSGYLDLSVCLGSLLACR